MSPHILLHGAGANGAVYTYLLLRAGCSVTVVCRSNYDAVRSSGFSIDSALYGKGIRVQPTNVVRTPSEATGGLGGYDFVIVTAKALPNVEPKTPDLISPAVTRGKTCIVLIQNGIGIEDEYAQLFPDSPILSCVVYLPTTQVQPGNIEMGGIELLQVGTYPASARSSGDPTARRAADTLISTLNSAGGNAQFFEDVQEKRWGKLLLNAAWNPICALTLSRDVAYLASSPDAEGLVVETMNEVVSIAQALGFSNITQDMARDQLSRALDRKGTSGIEPSMLVDVLNGRRMEVEVILGNAVRQAKSLSIPVPRLETLYALAKSLDEAIALRKPGKSLGGDETAAVS